MRVLLSLLCLLLAATRAAALYRKDGAVQLLTSKTFKQTVVDTDQVWVVEFFAPWCGHCKALAPQYDKVAENLKGIVGVAAVDCDDAGNRVLCSEYGIQGFPTIKVFPLDKQKNPYTGKLGKTPVDYNGPRTAKGIADAATAQIPSTFITKLKSASDFESFKALSPLPKAVLVSAKGKTTPLYKSLSSRLRRRMAFAEARDNVKEVVEELGTEELPALVVLTPDGQQIKYEGKLKALDLVAFLEQHAAPAPESGSQAGGEAETGDDSTAKGNEPVPQVVRHLALGEVEEIMQYEDPWLLALMPGSPDGTCAAETEALNKLAYDMGGLVNVGQVNVSDADAATLNGYGLDWVKLAAQPCQAQLLLLPFGDKSEADEWLPYTGETSRTAVSKFVMEAAPSLVTRMTADNMQPVMSIDMLRPKVILFTTKEETPAVFNALALNFRNYTYVFADVHASEKAVLDQIGVKKVPSMLIALIPPQDDGTPADPTDPQGLTKLHLQPYTGPLKYPYMHAYLQAFAGMIGAQPEGMRETGPSAASGADKRPAAVVEVADNAALEAECLGKLGLCVVALLDGSSSGLQDQLGAVKAAAAKHAQQPLHFLWVDAPRQHSFAAAFGVSPPELPTLVAFSPKKLRFARFAGPELAPEAISQLVNGLLSGRQTTTPLQEVPRLVDGGEEPAAAEDEPLVEEEFDLADILAEEVEGSGLATKEDRLKQVDQQLQEEAEAAQRQTEAEAAAAQKKAKRKSSKGKAKKAKKASSAKQDL